MCHYINCHPSVLQDHVIDSFRVCISNGRGLSSVSFPMLKVLRPFWNLSIHSRTIRCNMTLFPYCTDILLCISAPGTPSAHKNVSLPSALWCKLNADFPCLWHKTHDRNGLSRSHLHHNGRRGVYRVYLVMPIQQYSQLQNIYPYWG
jgi:hypothetical protein